MNCLDIPLIAIREPEWSWHYVDTSVAHKLTESLALHGQLRALVVRQVGEHYELVEGRAVLRALRELNRDTATVVNLGPISQEDAILVALSLELRQEIDYVRLGRAVAALADIRGDNITAVIPFTGVDIGYYRVLSDRFDWSQFHEEDRQEGLYDDPFDAPPPPTVSEDEPVVVAAPPPPRQPTSGVSAHERLAAVMSFAAKPEPIVIRTGVSVMDPWDEDPVPALPAGGIQFYGSERPTPTWTPQEPPVLDGIDTVVLNVESNGLRWWAGDRPLSVAVGTLDGQLKRFLPFGFTGGNLDEATVQRWAREQLKGKHIINVNTGFDTHMMREWGVDLEEQGCTFSDAQHYAALLDEYRREFALDILIRDFLQLEAPPRVDESRMATYHAGDVATRAEFQVEAVAKLREVMWPLLDKEDLQRVRQLEDDVIPVVCEMEKNAAHVDRARLKEMVQQSGEMLNASMWEVAKDLGFNMNPDSNEDWQKLFTHYNIPITQYTEKGTPSFTDSLLSGIDHPKVQLARRAGKIASLRSKFLLAYDEVVGDDNKLRFALHQLRGDEYGTIRGRFSMSGGSRATGQYGKNLQQVFRVNSQREAFGFKHDDASHDDEIFIVRSLFTPEAYVRHDGSDTEYLSADAQAIEYRIGAHLADAKPLIEAYQADFKQLEEGRLTDKWVDFHRVVGDMIRPYKDLSRNIVKNANFCLVYGGGEETATRTMGVSPAEGREIVNVWRRTFPEFKALHKRAMGLAENRGYVKTLLGRRARFPDKTWAHKALNYVIQGSAADIMKLKLVELHKNRKVTGLLMRMTVHDEVDGDAREPHTAQAVRVILNQQSLKLRVPIVWEVSTGKNWAEAK